MGNLIPGEPLVYEHVGKTIYARYRNKPEIPRWIIGYEQLSAILEYDEWREMLLLSDRNPIFKKELDKVVNLYYLLKDDI